VNRLQKNVKYEEYSDKDDLIIPFCEENIPIFFNIVRKAKFQMWIFRINNHRFTEYIWN